MKQLRFFRIWIARMLCCIAIVCLLFCNCAFAKSASPKAIALRDDIFSYVNENEGLLRTQMEEIAQWSKNYYMLIDQDDQINGISADGFNRTVVSDSRVADFFEEHEFINEITYPVNSDVVVFYVSGVGIVTSDIELGFYYSPDDTPQWINSEQLLPFHFKTGKYNSAAMLSDEYGWTPDKSILDFEDDADSKLDGYILYTERICENFFYYESSY